MTIKEQVVNRLLGICECQIKEEGCGKISPSLKVNCSRDVNHKGKHFACGASGEHKIEEWD